MKKLDLKTKDGVDANLEKLSQLFPEVITEIKDENGKIRRVADFEKLKMILGDDAAESAQEFYEFTWPGKNEAIMEAAKATTKTLRPCVDESKNWDTTQNLYIEGDNLEVLKLLQESYLGKVKMIYIDPPYNTGKDFVYRDNFHKSAEEGKEDEIERDEETGEKLFQNTESNGRFHSDWCSMIYPRLKLARDLLSDDGVIFISIDDNEVHNLRKICDEIFGERNFITDFVWEKGKEGGNDSSIMRSHYDNIMCYTKNCNSKKIINLDKKDTSRHIRKLPEDNLVLGVENEINQGELFQLINLSKQKDYRVKIPLKDGTIIEWDSYAPQTTIDKWIKTGKIFVGQRKVPYVKSFLNEEIQGQKPSNIITQDYGTTKAGSIEIRELFGSREFFSYPKPSVLLKRIVQIGSSEKCLILDFFSGSATTAHACMQLNAEDGGNRKFIMVQLPEVCAPESEAAKAGYKNICEIGKERIRRAGEKIKTEHATTAPNLDIGFRVLKLDESNMKDVYYKPNEISQDMLAGLESNIKEDRNDLDLLFACLIDWGVELSLPLKTETIDGVEVHTVNDGDTPDLIACFAQNIPESVIRKIAARHPLRAVFRDSSFADSPGKINVTEIFKTFSPNTIIKVL
ncbi:site-specific DNA-methyltransferase [Intestinicryptomonas porci]|uniref:site-specific DNA-methyltransferase (adenine-specific) n=1 Tax=Intestinicryptomonas porci TaxID=2926320 RepID=A0ABU4WHT1_9BACT|nr:site-specific DNA-methyltransferase [Opitutales bacterium CLA-KB-P66]